MSIEDTAEVSGEVSFAVMFFAVVHCFCDFFCGGVPGEPIGVEVEEVGELSVECGDSLILGREEAKSFFSGIENELREFGSGGMVVGVVVRAGFFRETGQVTGMLVFLVVHVGL